MSGEGQATAWEVVRAVSRILSQQGEQEAADLVLIIADLYLRSDDWSKVCKEDIVGKYVAGKPGSMAVLLRVPERGKDTKTGTRQGVRPDRPGPTDPTDPTF